MPGPRDDRRRQDDRPVLPLPLSLLMHHVDKKVEVSHWEGKSLKTTKGILKAFDSGGNAVVDVKGKQLWLRGATVQSVKLLDK
ncbi:MAG: hypothetical protein QF415_15720 [Candidatus Undinarchaeales archaeon]|nr:hypothetical protein [Candidatus Undinarchaeales archaeon]MDP7494627.1 hypothetical protein [Candidatus Undinarchaeales archaeon]